MANSINGEKGIWIGLIAYIVLAFTKILVGFTAPSEALKADGYNNATDILATIAVLIGLRISRKPADQDHRYGHSRAEMIGALIASFIMVSVGIQVLIQSIRLLYTGAYQTPDFSAAIVAAVAAVIMLLVYRYNRNLAKKINSQAIMAAAKDNLSDALVSIGTCIGILVTQLGLAWLDPLVSLMIGFIICKTAWEIFVEATHTLTDGYDPKKIDLYVETVAKVTGVEAVKEIKARSNGHTTHLDIIIKVNPQLNIVEGHAICDAIEHELALLYKIKYVVVHIEPNH